jgi:hypothetical protein
VNTLRVLRHLVQADFRERVRRYSFLTVVGSTIAVGYLFVPPTDASYVAGILPYDAHTLGDSFRGVNNSAWVGGMVALLTTLLLSLPAFYVVKGAVERDRRTGVGEVLAAAPLTRLLYTLGKWLSNVAVLAMMVGILAVAALIMQIVRGEELHIDLWALSSPFLFITLPVMTLVAAIAILFEMVPGLRGGLGNVVYFFLWIGFFIVGTLGGPDVLGWNVIASSVQTTAQTAFPDYVISSTSVGINPVEGTVHLFHWEGVRWASGFVGKRLVWTGLALGIVLLAAILFDRFDPAASFFRRLGHPPRRARAETARAKVPDASVPAPIPMTSLSFAPTRFRFWQMLLAELRLMLKGRRWWWYAVAAGLVLICLVAPGDEVRRLLLPLAWLWPVLIWSAMGVREARYRTGDLVFSAAHALRRQFPAIWLAGVAVAILAGSGAAANLVLAGDWAGLLAWTVGTLFVPTLALALGVWTGSSKPFEVVYVAWWYLAVNRVAPLDFMGVMGGSRALTCAGVFTMEIAGLPWYYLGLTGILLALASAGRRRQIGM